MNAVQIVALCYAIPYTDIRPNTLPFCITVYSATKHLTRRVGIHLGETVDVTSLFLNGTVYDNCNLCPNATSLVPEREFVMRQSDHIANVQRLFANESLGMTYCFYITPINASWTVSHVIGNCTTFYESVSDEIDCDCLGNGTLCTGNYSEIILNKSYDIWNRWMPPLRTWREWHAPDAVRAQLTILGESYPNQSRSFCVVYSRAPFENHMVLSGPGLLPKLAWTADDARYGYASVIYNASYPNVTCHITSPTGWSILLTKRRRRLHSISELRLLAAYGCLPNRTCEEPVVINGSGPLIVLQGVLQIVMFGIAVFCILAALQVCLLCIFRKMYKKDFMLAEFKVI